MMRRFGLIGFPLSHSFSPDFFKDKFKRENIDDAVYNLYELENLQQVTALKNIGLSGLNVTVPYKEKIIPFLDELDDSALKIMAVNTIVFDGNKMKGYNTDMYGFEKSLRTFIGTKKNLKCLILGTGGSSKAVKYVLGNSGINCSTVSRTEGDYLWEELDEEVLSEHHLIINTTPVGMYPNVNECPSINFDLLTENHFVMDLIYNPEKTLFLELAFQQGATIKNGKEMLIFQAEKSWEIWNQ